MKMKTLVHQGLMKLPQTREERSMDIINRIIHAITQVHPTHPMFVHFPIALTGAAFFFILLAWWRNSADAGTNCVRQYCTRICQHDRGGRDRLSG
jgi:hypothetical protein